MRAHQIMTNDVITVTPHNDSGGSQHHVALSCQRLACAGC